MAIHTATDEASRVYQPLCKCSFGVDNVVVVVIGYHGDAKRETASFDVLIVKIGAGVLAVRCRKNSPPKKN